MMRAALALALLTGCTSEHDLGSACPDGVCESVALSLSCLIDTTTIAQEAADELDGLCVSYASDLLGGLAPCRMYVTFQDGTSCAEAELPSYLGDLTSGPECELPQLAPGERLPTGGRATGWYFDEPFESTDPCSPGSFRVRLNGALDVEARVQCTTALAHFSDVPPTQRRGAVPVTVEPDRCGGLLPLPSGTRTPADIGAQCTTRVEPVNGFRVGPTHVETRTQQCTSGVCLVDTLLACKPPNVCSDDEIDFSVATYCSCRCDASGDDAREPCDCPEGFACFDVLNGDLPDSLAGGYCVKVE